ncbi:U5 snRNP complex subunit AAR2 NDAI_0A01610 [Naumovozyma dairenensis CBS 421]|uniref:A1 cistron-splicing factor AAR2 n=1 Tax=Naumovozyma dairenensis (strain ATCC 10597 / BCRC 20456 / CBS 421 / NBRC 0211 / NRRL Y-12639) TaxID=1071378 RepID=G0W3D1_NAUDC|nr:hypothetical protein NDAI_0A01610 [Naumovozyma dairenensis CBS 421]CCD22319.1 hypothetical protein NDAI_0A01610 [Naumovozyma dairenensis CBS 421]
MNIIFVSIPVDVTIGLDHYSFEIKKDTPFKGIVDIPRGCLHTLHFQQEDGMRYGYWLNNNDTNGMNHRYYVRYDADDELYRIHVEEDEIKYDNVVRDYKNRQLVQNYPKIVEEDVWNRLTEYCSWDQIEVIFKNGRENGDAISAYKYVDSSMTSKEESTLLRETLQRDVGDLTRACNDKEQHLHYTDIKFKSREAIRPHHEWEDFNDKSYYLNEVILKRRPFNSSFERLLGELQITFLNLIIFGNYGSSLQWHSIIELIMMSSQVSEHHIKRLDELLSLQLETLPEGYIDIFINMGMWNRCLTSSFHNELLPKTKQLFEKMIKEEECNSDIEYFDDNETEKENQNLGDSEEDEYKPTVVGGVYYS